MTEKKNRSEEAWVPVLDKRGNALMPCHPARARQLLRARRAVVAHHTPFVIRLKDRVGGDVQPVRICEDPGSKTTGIAVVREVASGNGDGPTRVVLFKMELQHRGDVIHKQMGQRSSRRKRRRSANMRYRASNASTTGHRRATRVALRLRCGRASTRRFRGIVVSCAGIPSLP